MILSRFVAVRLANPKSITISEPREDRIAFPHAQVFASDTFYEPADAEIDNFFMTTLEPVAGCTDFSACNHNPRASEDDGSCRRPVNMVCSQQHHVTTKMCQQAAPPPPPSQVYRPSSGQQYRPPPPPAIGGVGSSVGTCVPCSSGYQQPGSQFGGQVSHCGSRTEFIPEGQPFRLVRGVMEGQPAQQQGYGGYGGEALHAIVPVPTDYTVSFDITPDAQLQTDWSCIVHFTATGNNCCEYGDRAPGIWFHPNSHQVVVVDGQPSDGNARCTPSDALPPNQKTNIQVDMGKVHMEVTFTFADGRIATCEGVRKNRRQFSTVHVWAGDPFYEPALATIENFWMQENSPRAGCMIDAACNRNFKASRPDGSCTYPSPGTGCNGQPIQVDAATGITHFLGAQEHFNLQTDGIQRPHHDTVFIPLDYRVQFSVTPDSGVLTNTERSGAWGSLFHFTATGANCCEYGDRVPAVWFYPQSRRLHIVHGQKDSGNNHCSPEEQIPAGVATSVRIDIRQTHVEVWYKQGLSGQWQQRCTEKRTETHTWSPAHMYMPVSAATAADCCHDSDSTVSANRTRGTTRRWRASRTSSSRRWSRCVAAPT